MLRNFIFTTSLISICLVNLHQSDAGKISLMIFIISLLYRVVHDALSVFNHPYKNQKVTFAEIKHHTRVILIKSSSAIKIKYLYL